tara:strand:- start:1302 stop:1778 length:477 start_codon:yes stop_codon:yes gene_type:complete
MSKIKLEPNASGSGTLTISAPNTNTDRTISLTDTTGNIVTTGDSGTVTAPMLNGGQTGSAPSFVARAWLRTNNNSGTPVIVDSGNVSSITDNSEGNYTMNFTTAMSSTNYCAVGHARFGGWYGDLRAQTFNTGSFNYIVGRSETFDPQDLPTFVVIYE